MSVVDATIEIPIFLFLTNNARIEPNAIPESNPPICAAPSMPSLKLFAIF